MKTILDELINIEKLLREAGPPRLEYTLLFIVIGLLEAWFPLDYESSKALSIISKSPGNLIKEELEAREWTEKDLMIKTGISDEAIKAIIKGKCQISKTVAISLATAFDVSPKLFINLQKSYDNERPTDCPSVGGKE